MFRAIQKAKKNQKGFTLVELMTVVVIIGILIAIVVPVYRNVQDNAKRRAVEANLRTIDGAISMFLTENTGAPTGGATSNLVPAYLQAWPTTPTGATYDVVGDGTNTPYRGAVSVPVDVFGNAAAITEASLPVAW